MKSQVFLLILFLLTGCATKLYTLPDKYSFDSPEEGVIFGRMRMDAETFDLSDAFGFKKMMLTVKEMKTGKPYKIFCEEGGTDSYFFVKLPPGQYVTTSFHRFDPYPLPWIYRKVDFQVPFEVNAKEIIYVGTLQWTTKDRNIFTQLADYNRLPFDFQDIRKKGALLVIDDFGEASKIFRKRFAHLEGDITKTLLGEK